MGFVMTVESKTTGITEFWSGGRAHSSQTVARKRLLLQTNHKGTLQAWKSWPDFTRHQLTLAKLLEFFCWSSQVLSYDSFDGGKTSFFQVQDDLNWMRKRMIKEGMEAGLASNSTTISLLFFSCLFFLETGSYSVAQASPEHTMKPRMASQSWQPSCFSVHRARIRV